MENRNKMATRPIKAVEGSDFSVAELKVKELMRIVKALEGNPTIVDVLKTLEDLIPKAVPGLTREKLEDLCPSEIENIWKTFQEVNAPFLRAAEKMGIIAVLKAAQAHAMQSFLGQFFASLKQGTQTP